MTPEEMQATKETRQTKTANVDREHEAQAVAEMRSDYLLFGGLEQATKIGVASTRDYLDSLGYGRGDLRQAREAISRGEEKSFSLEGLDGRLCDFCLGPIWGGDFERLRDGRDRCSRCSRTVVASVNQFVEEYQQVRRNMEIGFDIELETPMRVRMVNAKEIQGATQEAFSPSPNADPRVLGFVAKTSHGQELWIENGSPRMAAITVMAHELTHVWQNSNWERKTIHKLYGKKNELVIYEGMATWVQVQYLLLTREYDLAIYHNHFAESRPDEYGIGYQVFRERYPLSFEAELGFDTPFKNARPL